MTVQQDISNLLQLQELDLKTRDIRNELAGIPRQIDDIVQNVDVIRSILQKEKNRVDEAETWRRKKEADISLQTELLNKSRLKLQSARNEKESRAAQREIDTVKKNIADEEKELIELMEATEHYRNAISEHEKEFSELEAHLVKSRQDGDERMAEIRSSLSTVDQERARLASQIEKRCLQMYERIHKRLFPAIVKISTSTCSGCNFEIRPQVLLELMRGDRLITCQSCLRILLYDDSADMTVSGDESVGA